MGNKYLRRAVGRGMNTILNGRELTRLIQEQERERRASRMAHLRSGAAGVHRDQNKKRYDRKNKSWKREW